MVGVAGTGWSGAPREHAGLVADRDEFAVPGRHDRSGDRVVGGGVEDGFDDHLAGRTAQVAELAGGDQVVAVFDGRGR